MSRLPRRMFVIAGVLCFALGAITCWANPPSDLKEINSDPVLSIQGLGKGTAPLDGPWQFHLGDDPAFAKPQAVDTTGTNGWEELSPEKTWGAQAHPGYTGYAWYRKHVHITVAPGASPDVAMMIRHIDDAYEIYWNGQLVGSYGRLPPNPTYPYTPPPQTFGLGPIRDGVLAFRVWKAPLQSFDPLELGGLNFVPLVGSPAAIANEKIQLDYLWLQGRQYYFFVQSIYGVLMVLGFAAWLRSRSQPVLLWIAVFAGGFILAMFLTGLRIPFSSDFSIGWLQPILSMRDIALWFLLLYLLKLDEVRNLKRLTQVIAVVSIFSASMDGALVLIDWSDPALTGPMQFVDGILTAVFTVLELYPLVLVGFALRKRLDATRWLVAVSAFTAGMISVVRIGIQQGARYTHWTIGRKISQPLFTINGNRFLLQTLADTVLLLAIVYAVYRYLREASKRQGAIEQELKSARELQQILIPESLPELRGFAVTSAYRPAQEVGGDFFQIIPLEGEYAGSTLVLLGDVSGKGLKAAMTVSLIVGAARTAARFTPHPAEILVELNTRLHGRMQGGFTTCLAMRLAPDGTCTMASAGHPGPFLNQRLIDLPGALPLGVLANPSYNEETIALGEGDHFSLYTDGLLEARNPSGEIFSFERLDALFAERPNAAEATQAAVNFGQDDDITVVTLTRLASGAQSTTELTAPSFAPA